ncbi:ribonuclease R [Acetobacter sp. TBRC 12305]|uniref:VacB/RNase II family 3'-5' exoribonuclease n=1 Tax=Acetobacter garciniae TaxID=2817435 RepID=A0A939HMR2_9PROT|nr:ribonuclease R family protein [Acetobacter garciniae]MBO1323761.1 VacB/RNase II family 3'-5' exoribonuclease [Acetobacter garciniae]MBX0343450.1 ribonuclease R [Acetobacter garciniae]
MAYGAERTAPPCAAAVLAVLRGENAPGVPPSTSAGMRAGNPPSKPMGGQAGGSVGTPLGLSDILRALGLPVGRKAALKTLLHDLAVSGALIDLPPNRLKAAIGLPEVARLRVTAIAANGTAQGFLPDYPRTPRATLLAPPPDCPALLPADLVLVRLRPADGPRLREARGLRLLEGAPRQLAVTAVAAADDAPATLMACDARLAAPLHDATPPPAGSSVAANGIAPPVPPLAPGEIALADLRPGAGQPYRICLHTRLGHADAPGMAARLSLLTHDAPVAFSAAAQEEGKRVQRAATAMQGRSAQDWQAQGRQDLRHLPFVTIDDATAHDFDDALWAEPAGDGWRLVVAIADVSHYVAEGSALDEQARARGTSIYLPGQVVPMLPPSLSEDACSLLPGQDRLCLFVDMHVGADGTLGQCRLGRGVMRSAARLTYEDTQHALDGAGLPAGHAIHALPTALLPTLWAASHALAQADTRRGATRQDETAWTVTLDDAGLPVAFTQRQRLPAHDLVAACMIAANARAATMLHDHQLGGLFRIHAAATASTPRPMACYSATPARHAGLSLPLYAHFTSPIRRYADLLNHRLLSALCESAPIAGGPLSPPRNVAQRQQGVATLAVHLNFTQRRADQIGQDCQNRLAALFLAPQVGKCVSVHAMTATRNGLRVRLTKTGTPSFLSWSAFPSRRDGPDDSLHGGAAPRRFTPDGGGSVFSAVLLATCPARGTVVLASPTHAC